MGCLRYRAIYAVDRGELTANGYFGSEYLLSSGILTIIFSSDSLCRSVRITTFTYV